MDDVQVYVDLAKALEASESTLGVDAVNKNITRIEVFKSGSWKTEKGSFSLSANDFGQMVDNYNNDVRPHSSTHGLPIDEEHSKQAAIGWLKEPKVEANDKGGTSLFMDAHWTRRGMQMVKDGTYKFFSPEVHFVHPDPEGVLPTLRNVLMGGGATNRPLFKSLAGIPALTASDGTSDPDNKVYVNNDKKELAVDLSTIRGKKNEDVTADERKVLDAAKDQLNDEEKGRFYPADKKPASVTANDTVVTDLGGAGKTVVTLDASELQTLQANAARGLEASEKLRRNEAEAEVTDMCFSETNGLKLPTDMKSEITNLWLDASEAEKATLKKIFEKTPSMLNANDRTEMGSGSGDGAGDAQSLLDDKVSEVQASEAGKKLSYSEALMEARRKYPDIAKEADREEDHARPQLSGR